MRTLQPTLDSDYITKVLLTLQPLLEGNTTESKNTRKSIVLPPNIPNLDIAYTPYQLSVTNQKQLSFKINWQVNSKKNTDIAAFVIRYWPTDEDPTNMKHYQLPTQIPKTHFKKSIPNSAKTCPKLNSSCSYQITDVQPETSYYISVAVQTSVVMSYFATPLFVKTKPMPYPPPNFNLFDKNSIEETTGYSKKELWIKIMKNQTLETELLKNDRPAIGRYILDYKLKNLEKFYSYKDPMPKYARHQMYYQFKDVSITEKSWMVRPLVSGYDYDFKLFSQNRNNQLSEVARIRYKIKGNPPRSSPVDFKPHPSRERGEITLSWKPPNLGDTGGPIIQYSIECKKVHTKTDGDQNYGNSLRDLADLVEQGSYKFTDTPVDYRITNFGPQRLNTTHMHYYTIRDLDIPIKYEFRIRAKNDFGYGPFSLRLIARPGVEAVRVTSLVPRIITSESIKLEWRGPEGLKRDQHDDTIRYYICAKVKNSTEPMKVFSSRANQESYTIENLQPSTVYKIHVITRLSDNEDIQCGSENIGQIGTSIEAKTLCTYLHAPSIKPILAADNTKVLKLQYRHMNNRECDNMILQKYEVIVLAYNKTTFMTHLPREFMTPSSISNRFIAKNSKFAEQHKAIVYKTLSLSPRALEKDVITIGNGKPIENIPLKEHMKYKVFIRGILDPKDESSGHLTDYYVSSNYSNQIDMGKGNYWRHEFNSEQDDSVDSSLLEANKLLSAIFIVAPVVILMILVMAFIVCVKIRGNMRGGGKNKEGSYVYSDGRLQPGNNGKFGFSQNNKVPGFFGNQGNPDLNPEDELIETEAPVDSRIEMNMNKSTLNRISNPSATLKKISNPAVFNHERESVHTSLPYRPITCDDLIRHVESLRAKGGTGFCVEYESLNTILEDYVSHLTCDVSKLARNVMKNRYSNVVCYDHTRVTILDQDDSGHFGSNPDFNEKQINFSGDYINANFITNQTRGSTELPTYNAYIATQAPMESTLTDFWSMIWQQKSHTIVMMTNLQEKNKVKSIKYWPDEIGQTSNVSGKFSVTLQDELHLAAYSIRKISLASLFTAEARVITHFQYTVWPEIGGPVHTTQLLQLMAYVRRRLDIENSDYFGGKNGQKKNGQHGNSNRSQSQNPQNPDNDYLETPPPVLVHCSSGVGRSAVFIAAMRELDRLIFSRNTCFDIRQTVIDMRRQRPFMLSSEDHYKFLHEMMAEISNTIAFKLDLPYLCKNSGIPVQRHSIDINNLNNHSLNTVLNNMTVQNQDGQNSCVNTSINPSFTHGLAKNSPSTPKTIQKQSTQNYPPSSNCLNYISGESTSIECEKFLNHCEFMNINSSTIFYAEYHKCCEINLLVPPEQHHTTALIPHNTSKNANKNQNAKLPYEWSRVSLPSMRGVAGSDYVNASFISGYRNLYDFIAYQTPYINDQVDDVWRTVWSHNIGVIVLLNKEGCSDFQQYWPDGRPARYLYFVVEPIAEYRELVLKHKLNKKTKHSNYYTFFGISDHFRSLTFQTPFPTF